MRELRVVRKATGEVVHRVSITGDKSESQIEKVMRGLLRNMDTDRFRVDDSADDRKER